jgi:hypothetical protein
MGSGNLLPARQLEQPFACMPLYDLSPQKDGKQGETEEEPLVTPWGGWL